MLTCPKASITPSWARIRLATTRSSSAASKAISSDMESTPLRESRPRAPSRLVHVADERVHLRRQLENLRRQVQELLVLPLFRLDHVPLVVGQDLSLLVRPVLADHDERAQKDGLERDDHR